jgi:hypothetical protein
VIAESGFSGVDLDIDSEQDTPAGDKADTVGWGIAVHKSDTVESDMHN